MIINNNNDNNNVKLLLCVLKDNEITTRKNNGTIPTRTKVLSTVVVAYYTRSGCAEDATVVIVSRAL